MRAHRGRAAYDCLVGKGPRRARPRRVDARGGSFRQYRRLRLTAQLHSARWARNVNADDRRLSMKVIRSFGVIALLCAFTTPVMAQKKAAPAPPKPQISEATREKAADQNANPDALVLADFQKRIDAYMAIHKDAAKDSPAIKETNKPGEIQVAQKALGAKIRAARADAKAGDIL